MEQPQDDSFDLIIPQGEDYTLPIEVQDDDDESPIDISGYTFAGQIRKVSGDELEDSFSFSFISAIDGQFKAFLTSSQTSLLDFENQKFRYDMFWIDNYNYKKRFMHGDVSLSKTITV